MEPIFAVMVGILFAISLYLMMSRSLVRVVIGVFVLGNAANLLIFTAGRLTREIPPLIPAGQKVPVEAIANPLPQALILTAIVISFALAAFFVILAYRAQEVLGTNDTAGMREAEPKDLSEADVQ
jgi:multicomponent Na+:H+ antiporter subunit C